MNTNMLSSSQSASQVRSIYDCVLLNDLDQLRMLVLTEPRLVSIPDESGQTPLMIASGQAGTRLEACQILVEDGAADPNQTTPTVGDSAVHMAASNGDSRLLYLLLRYGGSPTAKNRQGRSPADCCRTAVPQKPLHSVCVQFLEYCATNGSQAAFGDANEDVEAFGGRLAASSVIIAKPANAQWVKRYLSRLPELKLVRETSVDIVLQGPLHYKFKGGSYTTPIICYVSKRAVPDLYDEALDLPAEAKDYRDANYRCRIDVSGLVDLMINPKAKYIDPLSGVILVSVEEANGSSSATEFLFTVVAELFSLVPPLCKRKMPSSLPHAASSSEAQKQPSQMVPFKYYAHRIRHTTNGALEFVSTNSTTGKLVSSPIAGSSATVTLRQMALSCSSYFDGKVLQFKPKLNAILGVIPCYFDTETGQGGANAPANLASSGRNNNGSPSPTRPAATAGMVHLGGRTESIDESSARLDESGFNQLLTRQFGAKDHGAFSDCNWTIPVRIQLPEKIEDILTIAPRIYLLLPHLPVMNGNVQDCATEASKSIRMVASNSYIIDQAKGEVSSSILQNWESLMKPESGHSLTIFAELFTELQSMFGASPPIRCRPKGKDLVMTNLFEHIASATMPNAPKMSDSDRKIFSQKVLGVDVSHADPSVCSVCRKEPKGVRLFPCEHLLFCKKCLPLYRYGPRGAECPLCRSIILTAGEVNV